MDNQAVAQPGDVTHARLLEVLQYDPLTGAFRWRVTRGNKIAGSIAGSLRSNDGYMAISIDGKVYLAHRLAVLYMTGCFPTALVDHIDRVRTNNVWSNLREADSEQNCQNRSIRGDNTSGFTGVVWVNGRQKWRARIYAGGRQIWLGQHETPESAYADYVSAKAEFHTFHPEAAR